MEFLIIKTSDEDYKEIKKFESLEELLNFQKMCDDDDIIISPFHKSEYEFYGISKNHKIVRKIEIYDDWRPCIKIYT